MQDNLKEKYGITTDDLKRAVDQINFGKIACDGIVLVALVDLICNGDIAQPLRTERSICDLHNVGTTISIGELSRYALSPDFVSEEDFDAVSRFIKKINEVTHEKDI